jgi:anti-sigma factor RsiW
MTECTSGTDAMRDELPRLAQGALGGVEAARLRAHVAECPACAAELEVLTAAGRIFAAATPTIDTAAIARVLPTPGTGAPALQLVPKAKSRGNWMPRQYLAAAASLLLVGTLSLAALRGYFFDGDSSSAAGNGEAVAAASAVPVDLLGASGLSGMEVDELTALLDELESMEATVAAEPITMRRPIESAPEGI